MIWLGVIGGFISFLSTSLGVFIYSAIGRGVHSQNLKLSMDFALGLMLLAVAFSLVVPATHQIQGQSTLMIAGVGAFLIGGLAILSLKAYLDQQGAQMQVSKSGQVTLALALLIHNFPEGLASGVSLAGLPSQEAWPILASIGLQNIPEGMLIVACLRSMGWATKEAILGGIGSGIVELIGGAFAGVLLGYSQNLLPILLLTAGGAMFFSVLIELKGFRWSALRNPEFGMGLLVIPILNLFLQSL